MKISSWLMANGKWQIRYLSRLAVAILIFGLAGCGYTTRSMISDKYKKIYIVPFENKIDITRDSDAGSKYKLYRPGLESDITREVSDRYLFDGNLKPSRENDADLMLKSELIEFRKDPLRYDDNEEVTEYRINLVVNLTMWDVKANAVLWQESGFTGDTTYFTTGTEASAISDAITDIARRIVERTVEQW